ncbi:MAG: dephospho-CoA kinase [Actinobacteria bacterium]|nr:dephospho-CoA kinase [Actinomycetota bacterium]
MKVVGITGQIGAGKSSVAKLLATLGARVLDADSIARNLLEPETEAYYEVVDFFGEEVVLEDGRIDRRKLASIVFDDQRKLKALNEIIHPRVVDEIKDCLRYIGELGEGVDLVAIDVPILFGSGVEKLVAKVVVVLADERDRLERLKAQGYTESEVGLRAAAQLTQEELSLRADYVIENSGTLAELKEKVMELWRALKEDD